MRLSKKVAPYVFISPFYILFFIFGAFPILYSFFLSFHIWDGISPKEFVGLENYLFVLTDPWFWQSVWNTLVIFVLTTIPQHVIALFLAFILNSKLVKFKALFRSSYFLPYITSSVAVAMIFGMLYGEHYGILNAILKYVANFPPIGALFESIGLNLPVRWLGEAAWIKPSIALLVTWQFTGWNLIIYYAGLKNIPHNLYEAARVDGANMRQIFFKITLPMLRPVIFFGITLSIIGNLQLFEQPFILTGGTGGTGRAGLTTALYLYRTGFNWNMFGTGSAMAYILCIFIIILSLINMKIFQKR
ncbi:carbohydrate ABC transporter permease [Halothermothrix orenii]|uniref:Binding-protein-dependent transport systems inner membrane component n=1 Tax=Halothermothrix orenii (strain H 168 / OCM 544 / DSM 9562) TaxID=373903 RepID=B8D1V9_HALOH|nr:sugar ABC transporter permease [Halothermothrix orenii]ACL69186.1 binding-protein-dependent transport systems inner membrane component [Halothermothrix orenii H 168]